MSNLVVTSVPVQTKNDQNGHLEENKIELFKSTNLNQKSSSSSNSNCSFQSYNSSKITLSDRNDVNTVKLFAFAVCREYLSGVWKNIDFKDFFIERMSGGLTNYLYKCEISNSEIHPIDNEPTRILLRLYGENHNKNSSITLKDIVVSAIMSDRSLGPKLYGIFPYGRLEELVPASPMDQNDMYIPELSRKIAGIMANFHSLEMPFIKEPHWLFDTTLKYIKRVQDLKFTAENDIKRFNLFKSYSLEKEFDQLKNVLISVNSPVVFCHNDINVGNILKLSDKLMVIDYEYGSYNYRGFDFGNHFCEWMFNNNYDKHPYYDYKYELYPNREQQLNFLKAYINKYKEATHVKNGIEKLDEDLERIDQTELEKSNGFSESKSISNLKNLDEEQLLKEANYFALASHLFWAVWAICQSEVCKIKFEYLDYALARCDAYFKQKKILFPNGYINSNL